MLTIAEVMGRDVAVDLDPDAHPARRLRGDAAVWPTPPRCDRSPTGSRRYTLEEGLRRTAEWFTDPANLARYKTDIYNV